MRVAIILQQGFPFDPERPDSVESVVRAMVYNSRDRATTTILCDPLLDPEPAGNEGFDVLRLARFSGGKQRRRAIEAALHRLQPDFVEVHQDIKLAAYLARRLPGAATALYRHNEDKRQGNPYRRWLYARRLAAPHALICVSEAVRRTYLDTNPALAARSFVATSGIDGTRWLADPDAPREKLIVYAGRPDPNKGIGELIGALETVLPEFPDWRAMLLCSLWQKHCDIYDGYPVREVEQRIEGHDRIELLRDATAGTVAATLKNAAIAVVPTKIHEAFGLAAIEAHMAGTALISSGSGGLREVSGAGAAYLDAVTPDAIAEALRSLMRDSNKRLVLARQGQQYVLENHTAAKAAHRLDDIRAKIVTGRVKRT